MKIVNVTKDAIDSKQLNPNWYYYPSDCRLFIRGGSVVEEPGEYWESEFYYMGVIDDFGIMSAIDEKISSGAIKGEIDGYQYERILIPGTNRLTYEVRVTPLNRA